MITQIINLLQKKNSLSLICFSSHDVYKYLSASQRVAGFLSISMLGANAEILESAKEEGLPLVAIHRCPRFSSVHSIVTDDYFNAYLAYEHLFCLGHRHIALINHPKGLAGTYEATLGYTAAKEEFCGAGAPEYIYYHSSASTFTSDVLNEIQNCAPLVSAIICANERVAWEINDCLNEAGLSVPKDMSLVSFNISSQLRSRRLTSVGAAYDKIAEIAVDTILRFIENPTSIQTDNQVSSMTILKSDLSVGFSTAPPKKQLCRLAAGEAKTT
ncbi:MAG TPA: substrate-binding domain-containing protein [Clostridia bacterium]|nr:substrate-binding domain-containing protein [Clostridia bacterium]